jgi:hypothetical protein
MPEKWHKKKGRAFLTFISESRSPLFEDNNSTIKNICQVGMCKTKHKVIVPFAYLKYIDNVHKI